MPALLDESRTTDIDASEEFVDAGWWPYFKEHIDRNGVPFDRAAMQRICDRCNERIDETGDYAPLVLQHTRDDEPEFQPEYVGLVGPYRLGKIGSKKTKWAIFGRERVRKSKLASLKECPRRSVEYWADKDNPTNGYFDPISALPAGVTPELDLGIHYEKDHAGKELVRYAKVSRYEAAMPGGSNSCPPTNDEEKPERYQGGTLQPGDIQQLLVALSPVIKQAVDEAVSAMQPQGADPEGLLGNPEADATEPALEETAPALGGEDMGPDDFLPADGSEQPGDVPGEEPAAGPMDDEPDEDASDLPDDSTPLDDSLPADEPPAKKKPAKFAAAGDRTTVPFEDPDMADTLTPEQQVARYQKESADYKKQRDDALAESKDYKAKYQKEVDTRRAAETNLQALTERVGKIEASERRATRYSKLSELAQKGYTFDTEEELKDCEELSDPQFDKHLERIASKYQKVPMPGINSPGLRIAQTGRVDTVAAQEHAKVERYSKVAADRVTAGRKKGEKLDFTTELKRLIKEDPEKIAAA